MNHKFSIYQLSDTNPKAFMWFSIVTEKLGGVDFSEYNKVYEGEITGDDVNVMLENLFEIFNLRHPEDFLGHSLSTSDIVVLDDVKYYCDSFGWQIIK